MSSSPSRRKVSSSIQPARQAISSTQPILWPWRAGWIDDETFRHLGDDLAKSGYGDYIHTCLARRRSGT